MIVYKSLSSSRTFDYFDLKELGEKYVPYLFDRMNSGVAGVKSVAVDGLILFLKRNYYSKKTTEITKSIADNFYASPNYLNRILFIDIYDKFAETFSKRFLKANNFNEMAVKLADDRVANVRRRLFEVAVNLRRMFTQNENQLIIKLDEALNTNKIDKNKRVADVNMIKNISSLILGRKRTTKRDKISHSILLR